MKKHIALLLVAAIFIGLMNVALANEDEITFRGIPWGSSIKKTISMLEEEFGNGITYTIVNIENAWHISDMYIDGSAYQDGPYIKMTATIPGLKVAGFDVKSIERHSFYITRGKKKYAEIYPVFNNENNVILYFIPLFSEDCKSFSFEEGKLVRAVYAGFDPKSGGLNEEKFKKELTEKLNSLYGDTWLAGESEVTIRRVWGNDKGSGVNPSKITKSEFKTVVLGSFLCYENKAFTSETDQYHLYIKNEKEEKKRKQEEKEEQEKEQRGTDGL